MSGFQVTCALIVWVGVAVLCWMAADGLLVIDDRPARFWEWLIYWPALALGIAGYLVLLVLVAPIILIHRVTSRR